MSIKNNTAELEAIASIAEQIEVPNIQSISVNHVAQAPDENKNVNLTIPTKVSELANDAGYLVADDLQGIESDIEELDNKVDNLDLRGEVGIRDEIELTEGTSISFGDTIQAKPAGELVPTSYKLSLDDTYLIAKSDTFGVYQLGQEAQKNIDDYEVQDDPAWERIQAADSSTVQITYPYTGASVSAFSGYFLDKDGNLQKSNDGLKLTNASFLGTSMEITGTVYLPKAKTYCFYPEIALVDPTVSGAYLGIQFCSWTSSPGTAGVIQAKIIGQGLVSASGNWKFGISSYINSDNQAQFKLNLANLGTTPEVHFYLKDTADSWQEVLVDNVAAPAPTLVSKIFADTTKTFTVNTQAFLGFRADKTSSVPADFTWNFSDINVTTENEIQGISEELLAGSTYAFNYKGENCTVSSKVIEDGTVAISKAARLIDNETEALITSEMVGAADINEIIAVKEHLSNIDSTIEVLTDVKADRTSVETLVYNEIKNVEDKTAHTLALTIDSSTYIMTASLKNAAGDVISTQTIDLPLETMVISGSYDNENKKIILTLKNGKTVAFEVSDLIDGLVSETQLNTILLDYVKAADLPETIKSISVNGVAQTPDEDRNVDIEVPSASITAITVNGVEQTPEEGTVNIAAVPPITEYES